MLSLMAEHYGFPKSQEAERLMTQAITLLDALFRKSFEETLTITDDTLALAREEFVSFMQRHLMSEAE